MTAEYFSTKDLADRWGITEETLRRWRSQNRGPSFIKFEGVVRYPAQHILDYETKHFAATEAK